jgi:cytochrome c
MGLVGLHIVQKTPSAPQWIWATFEHTGNVEGTDPSFALSRRLRLSARLRQLNHNQQQQLHTAGSVLQNYELVGAQWPVSGSGDRVEPTFVSNTTMESFVQESSCLGCHASARTLRQDKFVASDFVYSLRRAQPSVVEKPRISAPTKPLTEWDKQNWKAIQRGHALSERTYELLPKYVGNKLHCSSCHLDVGRNLSSSPWIGMFAEGKYDTPQKFYDRINQCLQRSMNGKPIPTDGPEMAAFNAYLRWLDEQWGAQPLPTPGMPKVEKVAGDPVRGKAIFLQKCAACHSTNGEGRYESNTYFRPALWGPQSFNNLAGLGAKPEKMAGFLKHNMPFGSGGSLTLQESWDLTAFVVAQPRPVKAP